MTGGIVSLTSANCGTLGAKIGGTTITAGNDGTSQDGLTVKAQAVTAFAQGQGMLVIRIQNMDSADAFATLIKRLQEKGFVKEA